MKKLLLVIVVSLPIISCKTTRVITANTATTPAADTALQGDRMKSPVKQ